jgi:hypothetical protein
MMFELSRRIIDAVQIVVAWRLLDSFLDHFGTDGLLDKLWSLVF